jgi:hypothetical protein
MHQKLTLFALLIFSSLVTHAQKIVLSSLWRDSVIVINGNPNDWDQPFRYYDSKARIQYSVVNDATNLYISLKTMDEKAEMKILRTGMEVSLNATGKKKESATIQYPQPGDTKLQWIQDPADPEHQQLEHPDIKRLREEYALSEKRMKLVGFKDIPADIMPIENKYGIEIAIGGDKDNIFTYELKVPLKTFYKESISASDTLKPISIDVKVNSFDVPQQINTGGMTDPSVSNSGMHQQGYGDTRQATPNMTMPKTNDMAQSLYVQMRMKLAYK